MRLAQSLRTRLLAAVVATSALVLITSGVAIYLSVRASLLHELDSSLVQQSKVITSIFEWNNGRLDLELDRLAGSERGAPGSRLYFEIWRHGGSVLARSPMLNGLHLPKPKGAFPTPHLSFANLSGGRRLRLLAVTVRPKPEGADEGAARQGPAAIPKVTLLLASELGSIHASLARLAYLLAAVVLAAILASAGGAWWAVGFGLRPMRALAKRIESLGEEGLGRRVDLPSAPSELLSVVERLNQLLNRLEEAFNREKALLSNMAHELRTPLTGLSFTLEVALSRPRDPDAYMADMKQCLAIARDMQGMVDNLLTMARLEAGQNASQGACYVDLTEALEQVWSPIEDGALRKGLSIQWQPAPGLSAWIDPNGLRVILRNLLANAVDYSDHGGSLAVNSGAAGGHVEIRVANDASGLSSQDTERIFERFWRGDQARGGDQAHAGLGLTLSRQLAEAMQGKLEAARDAQGRLLMTLSLPAAPAPEDSTE